MTPEGSAPDESSELPKKPSIFAQVLPYLLAAVIFAWLFSNVTSQVRDEPYQLVGRQWTQLTRRGVDPESVEVVSLDGKAHYCGDNGGGGERCGGAADFAVSNREGRVRIQRRAGSRIPSGARVAVSYAYALTVSDVWTLLGRADLRLFVPVMLLTIVAFFLGEVYSFGRAYRWFSAPDLTRKEMFEVRGGAYVFQVALPVLAEALYPVYLWRSKRVPVTHTVACNMWVLMLDWMVVLSLLTLTIGSNVLFEMHVPGVGRVWLIVCAIGWVVAAALIAVARGPLQRRAASDAQGVIGKASHVLRVLALASWSQYAQIFAIRALTWAALLASNYLTLRSVGITPPPALALLGIPLVVVSIFVPIAVGGYGGPQLVAWVLFAELGGVCPADQAIAYSLLWSTGFLVGRAAIGVVLVRGFWRRCFTAARR